MPKCRVKRHSVTQPLNKPYRYIALTQGQNAIVDLADFEWLEQWNWCAERKVNGVFYAVRKSGTTRTYMHRALIPGNPAVDHRDGDGLNNRRENLRPCTHTQNLCNTQLRANNKSGYKGVCWYDRRGWRARITVNNKILTIGYFKIAKDAAMAYDEKARQFHGEFAQLNFPTS